MPTSLVLVTLAGLLHAASIATPWNGQPAGWLQLLCMTALVWQLARSARPAQGAWLGWAFSTAWLTGTFWWLFVAMFSYGGLDAWLAALAVLALAGVLSLYYAAACAAFVALAPVNPLWSATVFASLWMLAELARGVWFTGFGWGAAGYAHVDMLARAASYVGAYGVGALAVFIAGLIAAWLQRPLTARGLGLIGLAGLGAAAMAWAPSGFTSAGATLQVALLQGNIAQDEKFRPGTGVADALRWYGEQLRGSRAALVVAPETAIPLLAQQLPDGYWLSLKQHFQGGRQAALIGIPMGSTDAGYSNSALGLKPGAESPGAMAQYRYDKHHLVPFGEFVPPLFRWFTTMMDIPLGDFRRGAIGQPSFEWQGQRLAPNICYEDLFGEELGARFIDPGRAPTIFVNLSNIAWFGDTVALDQHLNISRMRALEFERPFLRATNTGDTAIIDHTGRVTHVLARYTRGVLQGEVQGRNGLTPFAWWVSRFGLWPYWLVGVLVLVLAMAGRRARNGGRPEPGASGLPLTP